VPLSLTKAFLQEHYWDLGKSAAMVAREAGTYPNDVRRQLLKYWPSLRDRSETMKAALAGGHATPPMAGRRHTAESKLKASASASEYQASLSAAQREAARAAGKARWAATPPAQQDRFRRAGEKGLKEAGERGSRLERFLRRKLGRAGVAVELGGDYGDLFLRDFGVAVFVCPPPELEAAYATPARNDEARLRRLRCLRASLHVVDVRPRMRPSLARMALVLDRLVDAVHSLPRGGPYTQTAIGDDRGEEEGGGRGGGEFPLPCGN
jgi:hypothetical protein